MTSPLLKKLRITLRSRRGSIIKRTLGALALAALLPASDLGAEELRLARRRIAPPSSHVRLIGLEELAADESPALERLKSRSAESRWDDLQQEQGTARGARPLPVETPTSSLPLTPEDQPMPGANATEPAVRDEIPMLPDAAAFDDFDQFETTPVRQVPQAPAPPVDPQLRPYDEALAPPDHVRALSTILPYHDFKGSSKSPFADENLPPGVDVDRTPEDQPIPVEAYQPRLSPDVVFSWEASNLWHNPLWFEDPALERYGHVAHPLLQPFVSGARMTTQMLGLPYQSTIDPCHKRRYTLGWYRPGECAPEKIYQIPFNWDAAAVQAGAVTAGAFILP